MKKLIIASDELVTPSELSRERLETIVSQIVDILDSPSMGGSMQLAKIIQILELFKLK